MPKYEKGDWVRKKSSHQVGVVTGHAGRMTRVRWFGAKANTETVGTVMLNESKPRALVLEGYLDGAAHSVRSSEPVLRKWLDMARIDLAYARVNILDDLPVIANSINKKQPPFVHIICHGDYDRKQQPCIWFRSGSGSGVKANLLDEKSQFIFSSFKGLPILFSTCLIGKYEKPMRHFRKKCKLGPIASYTREVDDDEATLFELLVYHNVFNRGLRFEAAVSKAKDACKTIGIRGAQGKAQSFVRCF